MVNPEKHTDKSLSDDEYDLKFAHCEVMNYELITYIKDKFDKDIDNVDVLNIALMLSNEIITAETDKDKERIKTTVCDIIDDKYKLNEFIFTNLAMIKAWNETTFEFKDKDSSKQTEKAFIETFEKKRKRYEYKAWNDEMKILKESGKDRIDKIKGGAC